jgi:hypothetical protein
MEYIRLFSEDPAYMGFMQGASITQAVYRALKRLNINDIESDVLNVVSFVVNDNCPYGTLQKDIRDTVDSEINEMISIGETIIINQILSFNPDNEMTEEELN